MSEMIPTEAEVVARLARTAAAPNQLDPNALYSIVDAEGDTTVLSLERFRSLPDRVRESVTFSEAASLTEYVKEHNPAVEPRAYAMLDSNAIAVVMNGHTTGAPAWGDWRATLTLKPSLGWARWEEKDGKLLEQESFAEHIEEGLLEITKPAGARMLEIVTSFHATNRANVDSAIRLDNGETQLKYVETIAARAGQSKQFAIPEYIELALAPFEGGATFKVRARFRYRLRGSELLLGYKLERPEDVRRAAFREVCDDFTAATSTPLFYGHPSPLGHTLGR